MYPLHLSHTLPLNIKHETVYKSVCICLFEIKIYINEHTYTRLSSFKILFGPIKIYLHISFVSYNICLKLCLLSHIFFRNKDSKTQEIKFLTVS